MRVVGIEAEYLVSSESKMWEHVGDKHLPERDDSSRRRRLPHPVSPLAAVLFLAAIMTIPKFYEVNSTAGLLLLPYIGWTCFASTLINCSLLSGNCEVRGFLRYPGGPAIVG
jgi:hypothetical protein